MELETINKLYLELSQISTAKTARELELERQLSEAVKCHESERNELHRSLADALKLTNDPTFHYKHCDSLSRNHWGSGENPCNCKPEKYKIKLLPELENLSSGGFTNAVLGKTQPT